MIKSPLLNGTFVGNIWTVTYVSNYPSVFNEQLTIDATGVASLTGSAVVGTVSTVATAALPHGYSSTIIQTAVGLKSYDYIISGLQSGVPYYVQVSATNAVGTGSVQTSVPAALAPPLQKPAAPLDVYLATYSAHSLKILWMAPGTVPL